MKFNQKFPHWGEERIFVLAKQFFRSKTRVFSIFFCLYPPTSREVEEFNVYVVAKKKKGGKKLPLFIFNQAEKRRKKSKKGIMKL